MRSTTITGEQRLAVPRQWIRDHTEPSSDGLPNKIVLLAFPAVLLIIMVALVAFGITGSSTGVLNSYFSNEKDPALIAGTPQAIRSDEWYVQTSWTISQVQQGFPSTNESFPGGMDATVQHDLPSLDWSVAFRPHLLGFFFLPLDNAMALKWWLPGFALMAACYVFVVSMLPTRPLSAAALSVGFFFAPFFQWWYLSITLWPAAWCFLVMAATIWLIRSNHLATRIVWPGLVGYVTITMGMGIYVPFIHGAVLVALAFAIGFVLTRDSSDRLVGVWSRLKAVSPLLLSGVAAVSILGIWILTRLPTVERFLGTVYPGERLEATGASDPMSLRALLAAPVTSGLGTTSGAPLASNVSEASTFFLTGLFLIVPFAWLLVREWKAKKTVDWLVVSLLALGALIVAFLIIPGWDAIAHLMLLDRTTTGRIRLALGLLSVVAIVVLASRIDAGDRQSTRPMPAWVAWTATGLAIVPTAAVLFFLYQLRAALILQTWVWILVVVFYLSSIFWFARGRTLAGALAFLMISVVGSSGANPLYVGVYDLNETRLVREMKTIDRAERGAWVGVGETFLPTVTLVQSGLDSYNGFQSAPPPKMWEQIDPKGRYESIWNRLANVTWHPGKGRPAATNPAPDQIRLTFDSCATFAQEYVGHVLADAQLDQNCLVLDERVKEGPSTFWIYKVVNP